LRITAAGETNRWAGKPFDNEKESDMRNLTKMLAFGGVILAIFLMTIVRSNAAPGAAQPPKTTITPKITATLPFPTKTPRFAPSLPRGKRPPQCTFPLAEIKTQESKPEEYAFSEPQVVLNDSYNLVEWLPDNQRILMTELSDQTEMGKPQTEIIELYNHATGEIKIYATHTYADGGLPAWQPELNAVVYPSMNFIGYDKTFHPIFTHQLWISYGDPHTVQMLADNMSQFPIAIKPDGSEIVYLANTQMIKLGKSLKKLSSTFFDPAQWDYGKGRRNQNPIVYKMVWQPNTSLIFLYSSGGITNMGGYTFIMDAATGKVCELDFGGLWARKALWSPDGRYLAIIRAKAYSSSLGGVFDMAVLDTLTGELHSTEVLPPTVEIKRYVDNFVWAPDNHHLLAVGTASSPGNQNNDGWDELYLVDFVVGESVSILPHYAGFFTPNLAWSHDGTKLLINCPTNETGRLCLISVNRSRK